MADPSCSARLIYRAIEPDEDEDFFLAIQQDQLGYRNSNLSISIPQGRASAKGYIKRVTENSMLGVVICLAAAETVDDETRANSATPAKPTPIGCIHLDGCRPNIAHHRFSDIGIHILPAYQGKGYGSEAIEWILEWAFVTAGLHRVSIQAFEYNNGAMRLYQRLGFKFEGAHKEMVWAQGRWWDDIHYGMLENDWRELHAQKKSSETNVPA
ncbi:hypothetical protein LTR78_000764 [Recurvomyces mirabilis]|uniref:N-acetyltransferase domain-containing protein n=1 Tax=Recurvomyces mirabilis TaxID=574656 RepID=A0AAE0WWJ2_9PEZI|nr:hypothetical protein LTR78_000764 [Recurvomyces mirabilis]KAK5158734.1 hypothetical protein LTS14_002842 [Recurvomyces mirabilis]